MIKYFIPSNLHTVKRFIVSKETLILLSIVLGISDYELSKALYTYVLEMPKAGQLMAITFAFIIGFLPKVTGQLLAQKKLLLSSISIFFGLALMGFIYIGQQELTQILNDNPFDTIFNDGIAPIAEPSNRHLVATLLTALLYGIATFISYLYYEEYEANNPKNGYDFKVSKVFRYLEAKLLQLDGCFQRAFYKPIHKAAAVVNTKIADCQKTIQEEEKILTREAIHHQFEMRHWQQTISQIENTIHFIYIKKPFFKRFKL